MHFSLFRKSRENKFWEWFELNDEMLFNFEDAQNEVFRKLGRQLKKVHGDLTFEFGPKEDNGKREFVLSAGGIKSAFPAVESLFSKAPESRLFSFIKFRPRRNIATKISFGGVAVNHNQVTYQLVKNEGKIGILLFFENYDKKKKDQFDTIGFLILDIALGEYDTEIKVGIIQFSGQDSEYFDGSKQLISLPDDFDNQYYLLNRRS